MADHAFDKGAEADLQGAEGPLSGPDPKDKGLHAMCFDLILASNKTTGLAKKVDAVTTKRSRVKAALPRVILEQAGKKSADPKAPRKFSDPKAAAKADNVASVVLRHRRDLKQIEGSGLAIFTNDAAVRVMVETTEKVQTISPEYSGYVLKAD